MPTKKSLVQVVIGLALSSRFAWASGDMGCISNWTLEQKAYDRCNNVPMLTPGNDTRVNLNMLLADEQLGTLKKGSVEHVEGGYGRVPFYIDLFSYNGIDGNGSNNEAFGSGDGDACVGQGTRCVSNGSGKADFVDAVSKEEGLPDEERRILIDERNKLDPSCGAFADAPSQIKSFDEGIIQSPSGKQFSKYLAAAAAFYEGRYDDAAAGFESLADSRQAWVKDAACYMAGRTELNRAQKDAFDEYGFSSMEKVDSKSIALAEAKFHEYLREHPNGRYAASAKGLLRRVYWMSGQQQKLADEYIWQMRNPAVRQNVSLNALVQEVDQKLLMNAAPEKIADSMLLAVLDLSFMRPTLSELSDSDEGLHRSQQQSLAELQMQRRLFAGREPLHQYLLAAHSFYVQRNPAAVLKLLPDSFPEKMTWLDFSRLALRALALEATKDRPGARRLWLNLLAAADHPLQSEAVQLALAISYEQSKETEKIFAENSPVANQAIRNRIMRRTASASLLRQIASRSSAPQERLVALHTLLCKDFLQGHYGDYIKDVGMLTADALKNDAPTDDYAPLPGLDYGDQVSLAVFSWQGHASEDSHDCRPTIDIAKLLAKDPEDHYGLICLGDFVNANGLDSVLNERSPAATDQGFALGSATSDFTGKIFSRGEAYKAIIADKKAAADLKAYALYRSIKCYAISGTNHCGGSDVDKSVRKSWFQALKKSHANSAWAKKLKYYW